MLDKFKNKVGSLIQRIKDFRNEQQPLRNWYDLHQRVKMLARLNNLIPEDNDNWELKCVPYDARWKATITVYGKDGMIDTTYEGIESRPTDAINTAIDDYQIAMTEAPTFE